MRKVAAFLMALSFVIAVSGLAFAGGADGVCAYSHTKQNTAEKKDTVKPIAKKSDSKTVTDQLLLAQKNQPNKKTAAQKK